MVVLCTIFPTPLCPDVRRICFAFGIWSRKRSLARRYNLHITGNGNYTSVGFGIAERHERGMRKDEHRDMRKGFAFGLFVFPLHTCLLLFEQRAIHAAELFAQPSLESWLLNNVIFVDIFM